MSGIIGDETEKIHETSRNRQSALLNQSSGRSRTSFPPDSSLSLLEKCNVYPDVKSQTVNTSSPPHKIAVSVTTVNEISKNSFQMNENEVYTSVIKDLRKSKKYLHQRDLNENASSAEPLLEAHTHEETSSFDFVIPANRPLEQPLAVCTHLINVILSNAQQIQSELQIECDDDKLRPMFINILPNYSREWRRLGIRTIRMKPVCPNDQYMFKTLLSNILQGGTLVISFHPKNTPQETFTHFVAQLNTVVTLVYWIIFYRNNGKPYPSNDEDYNTDKEIENFLSNGARRIITEENKNILQRFDDIVENGGPLESRILEVLSAILLEVMITTVEIDNFINENWFRKIVTKAKEFKVDLEVPIAQPLRQSPTPEITLWKNYFTKNNIWMSLKITFTILCALLLVWLHWDLICNWFNKLFTREPKSDYFTENPQQIPREPDSITYFPKNPQLNNFVKGLEELKGIKLQLSKYIDANKSDLKKLKELKRDLNLDTEQIINYIRTYLKFTKEIIDCERLNENVKRFIEENSELKSLCKEACPNHPGSWFPKK